MKPRFLRCASVALALLALSSRLPATTATGLASFEGEEEPTVVYHVSSNSFTNDSYDNLTNITNGFRATLRYRVGDWWDGDRNTTSSDRQRAEVKGLGAHQLNGETFEYQTTFRTNSGFTQAGHFCHIFQLKALDGDNGAPLVTLSLDNGGNSGAVQYWSGTATGFSNARSFTYTPGTALTVKIRITVSTSGGGEVRASINGDSLQGVTGLSIYRPSATEYRPKWGLYRGVDSNDPIGDDYIEHTNVSANKVTSGGGSFSGFYKVLARHSGLAVVVQSASTADSANIVQYAYGGSNTNDEWEIRSIGSGYYRFINRNSSKDMVVQSASTADGANIFQYPYGGSSTNDEWSIVSDGGGYYHILNRNSSKAVTVAGGSTSNNAEIEQRTYSGATYQQFQLVSVP